MNTSLVVHDTGGWVTAVPTVIGLVLLLADLVIKFAAVGILPANRKPSSAMAWLILILIVPYAGLLIFLILGRTTLGKSRLARQQQAEAAIRSANDHVISAAHARPEDGPVYLPSVALLNRTLSAMPLQAGNRVDLIQGYEDAIEAMTRAVATASVSVEVEFYISAWDEVTSPFFEAMQAAAERGVRVMFLFDHMGSRGIPGYKDFLARLRGSDIEWHPMLPVQPLRGQFRRPDLRNHRKILVVDGLVAFCGSQNLVEPGYNKPKNHAHGRHWVELVTRIEGPTVQALRTVFAKDWFIETGESLAREVAAVTPPEFEGGTTCQVVPSGPGYTTENNLRLFTTLVYAAQRRISLTSPYFVPDEGLLYAVTTAAQRGVDVELFVSEVGDQFMVSHAQCSYYQALLEAGVRIYLYPAPAVLHSKHLTIDDDIAVIGSSNMDMRSFALNYEVSVMHTGGDIVSRTREVEDAYRALSRELTLVEWADRPARTRYVDNAMRLTSSLQ